jgi:hypothetical protein
MTTAASDIVAPDVRYRHSGSAGVCTARAQDTDVHLQAYKLLRAEKCSKQE